MPIRPATADDAATIHRFICALAAYEREPDAVEVTPADLATQLARRPPPFECLIAEHDGAPVGFALFFHTYSTWRGRQGIWLEDLWVDPDARRHGVGRALVVEVARIARARGCGRLEWSVLNWNELALGFYRKLGAEPLDEWTVHRLTGPKLEAVANLSKS